MSNLTNEEKYWNYREQFARLKKALSLQFFLEAASIEYAIFEDRVEAVLSYENNQIKKNDNEHIGIKRKLKRIQKLSERKDSVIRRYFPDELVQNVIEWVDKRNDIVHAYMIRKVSLDDLREYAEQGYELCKVFRNKARSYKSMVDRINQRTNILGT